MRSRAWLGLICLFLLTGISRAGPAPQVDFVPAGTILNVRTTQPIIADYSHVGMTVRAIVDDPVADAEGRIVIPRGSLAMLEVIGARQSSNLKGRDRITLRVLSLDVRNRTYPVASSYVELKGPSEGKRAGKKIGVGAGIGAAIGGILGGGAGAAIGATAGGATGAFVAGSGKTHLNVPAESVLQFQLDAPVQIER